MARGWEKWDHLPHPTGEDHPRWQGGERTKECQECGKTFGMRKTEPISTFRRRKFCSQPCGWKGQRYLRGPEHPCWKDDARRKNRGGAYRQWQMAVLNRDKATCQRCGATGIELHAHHLKSYKDFPDLRYDVTNGETLCFRCHWAEHTALHDNAVKSGNTPPAHAKGNPEPSQRGDVLEGLTTRGRVFRRWVGPCTTCGATISKPLSDIKGKRALFCNRACRGLWTSAQKMGKDRTWKKDSNASTSAAPERDDIV